MLRGLRNVAFSLQNAQISANIVSKYQCYLLQLRVSHFQCQRRVFFAVLEDRKIMALIREQMWNTFRREVLHVFVGIFQGE
jgi:hypothetical protein